MPSVIFVLLDGLSASAVPCMGYMRALVEGGRAAHGVLACEMPPLSRPAYATLLSGRPPLEHGVLWNSCCRRLDVPELFSRARDAGLHTAAAAYHWMSELCNRAPYVPARDRMTDDPALPMQHGLFYSEDTYPDSHVFLDAECLRRRWRPDLLLVHSMGIDDAGHRSGGGSAAYRNAVRRADMLLAEYMPAWLDEGAAVVVTSDHGMSPDAQHDDTTPDVRNVPWWLAGDARHAAAPVRQTDFSGLVASLLGLP